jgi:hypothetical protein
MGNYKKFVFCLGIFSMLSCSKKIDTENINKDLQQPVKKVHASDNTGIKPSNIPINLKGYSAITWNEKKVNEDISVKVLGLIKQYNMTFVESNRDCRVSKKGIMMSLSPTLTITFEHTNLPLFSVDLYEFTDNEKAVQFVTGKRYYHSIDKHLIKALLGLEELTSGH